MSLIMTAKTTHNKILFGVTGSIAAYKAPHIVRRLRQKDYDVQVVLTQGGARFTTPLTLSTVSGKPVLQSMWDDRNTWHNHVMLAKQSSLLLIAPASANCLAKLAHGQCDEMLYALYLSATCPVVVAPAMDLDMWKHASVQRNVAQLKKDGVFVLEPASGALASGLEGKGRLPEVEEVVLFMESVLQQSIQNS